MRRPFLMLSVLLLTTIVAGQDVKQDFADGEFFLATEEYEEALYTFTKVYNNNYQENANVNFRVGLCLVNIPGRKTEAIPYLEKAISSISDKYSGGSLKEQNAPPDAHVFLGNAYRINMEFEKACEQYRIYDEYVGSEENIQSAYAAQQISSCANAVVAINNPVELSIGNLGQINDTHQNTYNRVISSDLKTMAYMGKNPFYRGIYVSTKEGETWSKPKGINVSVVSEGNMDVVSLSADGKAMLFSISDEFGSNLYMSVYENKRWNPAKSLGKPINSRYYESFASMSPDNKTLYFTSNRKSSLGGMDIFSSKLQDDGSWGDPENLGLKVNTELNEETPVISPNGKRIYFSSQGHKSIGGFDVYYSDLQNDGSWGEAVNLGYPLNTTDDDFTISPIGIEEENTAFLFAAGESGQHPLFKFELIDPEATPQAVAFDAASLEELERRTEETEEVSQSEPAILVEKEAIPEPEKQTEKYLIQPVFFAFDKTTLNENAKSNLDDISKLMKQFPSLHLDIIGHTDAVGTFDYNKKLSVKRAKAVSDYLATSGIDSDRLKISGLSESDHVAINRTQDNRDAPEGRKLNRRVQFDVSVEEDVIIEMKKIEVPDYLKITEK